MWASVLSLRAFRKEAKIFLERLSTIISSISTFFTSNSQEYCLVNLINFYTMAEDRIARLLKKLEYYGINELVYGWIRSWLLNKE